MQAWTRLTKSTYRSLSAQRLSERAMYILLIIEHNGNVSPEKKGSSDVVSIGVNGNQVFGCNVVSRRALC
jgi:hypothetical protein